MGNKWGIGCLGAPFLVAAVQILQITLPFLLIIDKIAAHSSTFLSVNVAASDFAFRQYQNLMGKVS